MKGVGRDVLFAVGVVLLLVAGVLVWPDDPVDEDVAGLLADEAAAAGEVHDTLVARQAHLALFAVHGKAAADDLVARLRAVAGIAAAGRTGVGWRDGPVGRTVFAARLDLLLPGWLAAHNAPRGEGEHTAWAATQARQAVDELERFLADPGSLGFDELLAHDPLLLLPDLFAKLETARPGDGPILVWARQTPPPTDPAAAATTVAGMRAAVAAVEAEGAKVDWFAVARHAEASRDAIRGEVVRLNLLSVAGVMLVVGFLLRRPSELVHLVVPVLLAIGAGVVAVLAIYGQLSILVLVLGSMLAGVAIDFGVHTRLHAAGGPVRLGRALLLSGGSTMAGFAVLLAAPLTVIAQTGLLVAVGIGSALFACFAWRPLRRPGRGVRFPRLLVAPLCPNGGGRWTVLAGGVVVLAALTGWVQLEWRDDPRIFAPGLPTLETELTAVQEVFGSPEQQLVFVGAATPLAAVERFHAARDRLGGDLLNDHPVATLFPPPAQRTRAVEASPALAHLAPALRRELAAREFAPDAFAPFFTAFAAWRERAAQRETLEAALTAVADDLTAALQGPEQLLLGAAEERSWVTARIPAADLEAYQDAGFTPLAPRADLAATLGAVRGTMIRYAAGGLLLIALVLVVTSGPRPAVAMLAPPVGALLVTPGLLAWVGPLNLLHLVGLLLGVCLALDYSVFATAARRARVMLPPSVRVSALTTGMAFGVLMVSGIEAVAALGTTVLTMIIVALAVIELQRRDR